VDGAQVQRDAERASRRLRRGQRDAEAERRHQPAEQWVRLDRQSVLAHADVREHAVERLRE
jgi:hypothetical protein